MHLKLDMTDTSHGILEHEINLLIFGDTLFHATEFTTSRKYNCLTFWLSFLVVLLVWQITVKCL